MIILGVILLLLLINLVSNTVLTTVEVLLNSSYTYSNDGDSMYTLYCNRLLVEARVHGRAENNGFIRLFRFPERIRIISKEDSNRVLELREELKNKESELSLDFVKQFPYAIVIASGNRHYILLIAGTPEAIELYKMFSRYMFP